MERWISDPLGSLIDDLDKCVRDYQEATPNIEQLVKKLREASEIRNVLCHGSWERAPDANGYSVPFFVNKHKKVFDTPINTDYLNQVQLHVKELICSVINTVTQKGLQFPGSNGPGKVVW